MLGNFLSVVTTDILSSVFFFFLLMNYKSKGWDRAEASRDFAALALGIDSLHVNTPAPPPPASCSFLLLSA